MMNLTDHVGPSLIANTCWVFRRYVENSPGNELYLNDVIKDAGERGDKLRERMLYAALLPKGVSPFDPVNSYYESVGNIYQAYEAGDIPPQNVFDPYRMLWVDFFDVLLNGALFKEIHDYTLFMLRFYADRMLVYLRGPGYEGHRVILVTPYDYYAGDLKIGEFW